jgi:hypothetical protein
MNLLDGVKNISKMVKQYNDLELNQQIIDLTQQALDLVNENARLTAENEELRKKRDIESHIIRHEQPFITLEGENENIRYCATCWGKLGTLIQLRCSENTGGFECPECHTEGIFNQDAYNAHLERDAQLWRSIYSN